MCGPMGGIKKDVAHGGTRKIASQELARGPIRQNEGPFAHPTNIHRMPDCARRMGTR